MNFFSQTLFRKITFWFLTFVASCALILFALRSFDVFHFRFLEVAVYLGTALVFSLVLFGLLFSRPLYLIVKQMEALLTGRPYKKIYTDRIDEIGVLAHFFNEVTSHMSSFTRQVQDGERMAQELDTAASIQRSILPLQAPVVPGLIVTAKNRPAVEVGGDSFDFVTFGDRTFFYIGDVAGHGAAAGLIMSMVNMLVYTYGEVFESPYDLMVHLNRQLKRRIPATRFMTMVMMKWDHVKKTLSYVGAGHEHILVFRAQKGIVEIIKTGGVALGMIPDNSGVIREIPLDLAVNDMILLYTDGISEARNMSGEMFGLQRLQDSFLRYGVQYNPEGIAQHIADDLAHFMQGHKADDDMSLIVVKYVGDGQISTTEVGQPTDWK
jgi:serine phosphatase RsbU (regulator of sigma subunit)